MALHQLKGENAVFTAYDKIPNNFKEEMNKKFKDVLEASITHLDADMK